MVLLLLLLLLLLAVEAVGARTRRAPAVMTSHGELHFAWPPARHPARGWDALQARAWPFLGLLGEREVQVPLRLRGVKGIASKPCLGSKNRVCHDAKSTKRTRAHI